MLKTSCAGCLGLSQVVSVQFTIVRCVTARTEIMKNSLKTR